MFTALLSVVLAVALGVAALTYSDEEHAAATPAGPIEGSYVFVSTTIRLSVSSSSVSPIEQVVTGGRLAIGGDGHVAWSLQIAGSNDAATSGRLSCEGSYDRSARIIQPEPRFGFSGFPPGMDRREVQDQFYARFCSGAPAGGTIGRPWQAQNEPGMLRLDGAGGSIIWRRE
jgi:hypothetical protein